MNRGIYLSIPEPDKLYLINTALSIAKSYYNNLEINYKEYYESLSKAYFDYREFRKKEVKKK